MPAPGEPHTEPDGEQPEIEMIASERWRVTDSAAGTPRLLAYIERIGEHFEVFQLGATPPRSSFETWSTAVDWATESGPAVAERHAESGMHWKA